MENLVTFHILLWVTGAVAVQVGGLLVRKLRRWTARSGPDLTTYDPGPDFLDWLQAAAFVMAGMAMLMIALVQ